MRIIVRLIKNFAQTNNSTYQVKLNENTEISAFLDTGNVLRDPYFNKPVLLVKKGLIDEQNNKKIIVPFKTINGCNTLECLIIDEIEIKGVGKREKVVIGLVDGGFLIDGIDMILNKAILEETNV